MIHLLRLNRSFLIGFLLKNDFVLKGLLSIFRAARLANVQLLSQLSK